MEDPRSAATVRYDFLDWLRVIAIFVLLFYHTGMVFVGWGWHIVNAETIPALGLPMDLAHRLRMPLLFVIAGAGLWFALGRRGAGALLRERTLRLLVPVIVGMLVIVPPQIFFERTASGSWSGSYLDFLVERVFRFRFYPRGDFSWHHLWFIVYLFVYVLLLTPLLVRWRRSAVTARPGYWLYLFALPLGVNEMLLKHAFPETHLLVSDWYTLIHYLLLTVYGFALAASPGAWDWLAAHRHLSLASGIVVIVGILTGFETGVIAHDGVADALLANVFTWLWVMVFLGYGRAHLDFSNRLLTWAREASYPVYILHQTVIVALAFFIVRQPWHPWTKYGAILIATILICVPVYEVLIRRIAVLRLAFGMRPAPARRTSTRLLGSAAKPPLWPAAGEER